MRFCDTLVVLVYLMRHRLAVHWWNCAPLHPNMLHVCFRSFLLVLAEDCHTYRQIEECFRQV